MAIETQWAVTKQLENFDSTHNFPGITIPAKRLNSFEQS